MPVAQNMYLVQAYKDYMQARANVQAGFLGNAGQQRDRLRLVYRFVAGKPL